MLLPRSVADYSFPNVKKHRRRVLTSVVCHWQNCIVDLTPDTASFVRDFLTNGGTVVRVSLALRNTVLERHGKNSEIRRRWLSKKGRWIMAICFPILMSILRHDKATGCTNRQLQHAYYQWSLRQVIEGKQEGYIQSEYEIIIYVICFLIIIRKVMLLLILWLP